jgi:hypothetical protein
MKRADDGADRAWRAAQQRARTALAQGLDAATAARLSAYEHTLDSEQPFVVEMTLDDWAMISSQRKARRQRESERAKKEMRTAQAKGASAENAPSKTLNDNGHYTVATPSVNTNPQ